MMAVSTATDRVTEAAAALGLHVDIREFPEGTRTAEDAARAIAVQVGQIVKSLVFFADEEPVLCLVSGANQVDTERLASAARCASVRRADAEEARAATGYSVGGVPPFGHDRLLTVYCDRDLLQYDTVWAAAGTPTSVFAIAPAGLVKACGAVVTDLRRE